MPLAESAEQIIQTASINEKITIIKELLTMLTSLHAQNIAHRDIKPANILYYNGGYVLSDFGLVFSIKKPPKLLLVQNSEQNGQYPLRWSVMQFTLINTKLMYILWPKQFG